MKKGKSSVSSHFIKNWMLDHHKIATGKYRVKISGRNKPTLGDLNNIVENVVKSCPGTPDIDAVILPINQQAHTLCGKDPKQKRHTIIDPKKTKRGIKV